MYCRVWTRKFGTDTDKVPLVLLHGMGAGLAMFVLNFSALAADRTVYAIDLPGFGRSSRVDFSSSPGEIEAEYVDCLDAWRMKVGLERINLVGHSFGGHLTGLYALKYPQHLHTATLADPWGMTERPSDPTNTSNSHSGSPPRRVPGWVRVVARVLVHFNPLWGLRAAGPAGPWLVGRTRPDIVRKYEGLLGEERTGLVSDYIFHCNGHTPTGESAFHRLMSGFGWANSPLLPRLGKLEKNGETSNNCQTREAVLSFTVKLNVMYGSNSWMTHLQEEDFRTAGVEGEVEVTYIEGAGHHIYSDQPDHFNNSLSKLLQSHDS